MTKPVLSICIPTYNKGLSLYKMITDFLETENNEFEIIVSDNHSTDGSLEKLKTIEDNRFILIENEENRGSYINSLIAFGAANGEYMMPLMDKDFISSEKINEVISLLKQENFCIGYFELDYNEENSFVERFYTKADCIKNFAYGTRHPSGFLFNNEIFKQKKLYEKYKNADETIKSFMIDFLAADLCEYAKGAVFHIKFAKMAHPPFEGVKHSYTYSPEKGNLFFTPENRFKAFKAFIAHLNLLDLTEKERIDASVEMLKQLYQQSTDGYIKTLNDKAICNWYNVSENFKNREFLKDLEKEFKQKLAKFRNFKNNREKNAILRKFNNFLCKNNFKKFKKNVLPKIFTLRVDLAAKSLKKYFHRKRVLKEFKKGNINLLWREINPHNETSISKNVNIDKLTVGNFTYGNINMYHSGNGLETLKIGSFCSVAPDVTFLLASEHGCKNISTYPFKVKFFNQENEAASKGSITVGDDVWIGYGAIIMSGVTIGQGAVIGAGSVVTKDIPPYAIAVGTPAKVLKYRFSPEIIRKLLNVDFSALTKEKIKTLSQYLYKELTEENIDEILNKISAD